MLIAFHCFSIFIFQLWRNRKRFKNKLYDIKFDPPVYRQRYAAVYETLLDSRWRTRIKKLVDFGCAEFGLFVFVKRLTLNDLFLVDIQEELMVDNLGRLRPLIYESIKRRNERFDVSVLIGSVANPDCRLCDVDCVTAIELIEHLYPDDLDAFPYNVFGYVRPKIVIITTPNIDFNVIFNLGGKFRHDDHKFEWTRQQFCDWCNNIISRFPDYTVQISGIGEGPTFLRKLGLGCCSQIATFVNKSVLNEHYVSNNFNIQCECSQDSPCKDANPFSKLKCTCVCSVCQPNFSVGICSYMSKSNKFFSKFVSKFEEYNPECNMYYKLVEKIEYPVDSDTRTEDEKMRDLFKYRINNLWGHFNSRFYIEERERCEIPLVDVLYGCEDIQLSDVELRDKLQQFGYKVENCKLEDTEKCEPCVIYVPEMEDYASSSDSASGYNSENANFQKNEDGSSEWEDDDAIAVQLSTNKDSTIPNTTLTTGTEALFDSGYQKSSSLLDDSPQTPYDLEADIFETSSEDSHKSTPKNGPKKLPDPDKINELDAFGNVPQYLIKSHVESCVKKSFKENVAGPSNSVKKSKKKVKSGEIDEGATADVKSVAETILENTLNKINVDSEREIMKIREHDEKKEENMQEEIVEEEPQNIEEQPEINIRNEENNIIVENGDLANNNRDREGNNYVAEEENIEEIENNNDMVVEEELILVAELPIIEAEAEPLEEVAAASREALFDPDSERDLLDDLEVVGSEFFRVEIIEGSEIDEDEDDDTTIGTFPRWLLRILGTSTLTTPAPPEGDILDEHDEPHFYCQGDGLGVHPSVMAVDGAGHDDADDETTGSSDEESLDDEDDFAQAEADLEPSYQELSSLPEESESNHGNNGGSE